MLRIQIRDGATRFLPGSRVEGSIEWLLDIPPEFVELRLFWYTRGKGTQDAEIASFLRFDAPGQQDSRAFILRFPDRPYSFSGKLISLVWALELVTKPSTVAERAELVMSPTGEEISLYK